jgi:hypothetical protein
MNDTECAQDAAKALEVETEQVSRQHLTEYLLARLVERVDTLNAEFRELRLLLRQR